MYPKSLPTAGTLLLLLEYLPQQRRNKKLFILRESKKGAVKENVIFLVPIREYHRELHCILAHREGVCVTGEMTRHAMCDFHHVGVLYTVHLVLYQQLQQLVSPDDAAEQPQTGASGMVVRQGRHH
jgi:hypothetical protein